MIFFYKLFRLFILLNSNLILEFIVCPLRFSFQSFLTNFKKSFRVWNMYMSFFNQILKTFHKFDFRGQIKNIDFLLQIIVNINPYIQYEQNCICYKTITIIYFIT